MRSTKAVDCKSIRLSHVVSRALSVAFRILLLFPVVQGHAQYESFIHSTILQGIDQLYNMEFEEAAGSFDKVIRTAPRDPRGYFFKSAIDYWIYFISGEESAYKRFFALSDSVIDLCEQLLEADERNWSAKFYLGGIYGFRGLMYQRNGSILKALWDGKKGYSRLRECAQLKPDLVDAQMGFGLYTYLVGKIPKSLRWIVNIIGFSGDVDLGIKYIRNAAENGVYTRSEATYYLSQFLYQEGNQDEALRLMERLQSKHPDNSLFLLTYGSWQSRKENIDTALAAAKRAVEINNRKKVKYGDEIAYNVLAQCYWVKNDFKSAKENIELSLQRMESSENIGNYIYYRLGLCYEILGDRIGAVATYRRMKEVRDKDRANDTYYYRKGLERISTSLSDEDLNLIEASNESSMKRYSRAKELYERVLQLGNVDQRSTALYGMQRMYFNQGLYDSSLAVHSRLVKLRPPAETWTIPHSYYLAGQALEKQGRKNEAVRSFEIVNEFDDYDFQQSLEDRTDQELERLREAS